MFQIPFAYVGPGAGFAFLGSFFSILLSLLAGIASLLLWPFRAVLRLFRGHRVRERVILLDIESPEPEGPEPDPAEELISARKLSHRTLRTPQASGWARAAFWKKLADHAVDSTALLVPGLSFDAPFRGRWLCRTADGRFASRPDYYARYLARLLGPQAKDEETLFFSALDHQKSGLLACRVEAKSAETVDRMVARLLTRADRNTTIFILFRQSALFSNRSLDADVRTTDDLAPAILRIFGFA